MKNIICLFLFINIFYFNSCDILRFSQFEVVSWSPGDGFHSEPKNIEVSLLFSHNPNIASVERNFSLAGDGSRVRGIFRWEGKRMTFLPLTPLEENIDYTINLSADAYDTDGLNMDEAFNRKFTTRPDNTRPILISCFPEMYADITDPRAEIKLHFSLPIPIKTLYDNVSFSPSMTGIWRLEDDDKLAVFTPLEPWIQNNRYEIRFSASLTDNNGMNIGNDFLSVFTTGDDKEIPVLLEANRITKDGEIIPLSTEDNQDWEKDDKLSLVFSRPVDSLTVKNYTTADDGPNLIMETSPGFKTEFIFRFESMPVYESRFTLRIKPGIKDVSNNSSKEEYVFRVHANGKFSKPPALMGIRMPMVPNSGLDPQLVSYGTDSLFQVIPISDAHYPSGESVRTWIELYFITAESALIDPFSIMELFRIETSNNVFSFSPRQIKTDDFTISEPQSGWEIYQRIEIAGNLVNSTNYGVVNILIASGLRDSLGNVSDKQQRISLNK